MFYSCTPGCSWGVTVALMCVWRGFPFYFTALCIFWSSPVVWVVLQSQVSSSPGASLVLNVFTPCVSLLWVLKWMRWSGLFSPGLLPGSCECPGAVCQGKSVPGKVKMGWGSPVLYGLLEIWDLYVNFLLRLHIILCKTNHSYCL